MTTRILPVVYIAGPYRAPTPWLVLGHVRAAQETALRVWKMGAVALCPHSNTGLFDGECEDRVWLEGDQELLRRCDAVLMMDKWRESKGSVAEYELAVQLGIPVFEMLRPLKRWIEEWKVTRVSDAS